MLARTLPGHAAAVLRHRRRAHAACIATPHAPCRCDVRSPCDGSTRPRYAQSSRFSRRRLPLGCARGHWLSSPPNPLKRGSPKVRGVLASSRKRLPCAAGGASLSSPPSPPQGRYTPRYAVSAAVGGPVNAACGRVAPASCWAASSFNSPVGPRNGPSLRFGLLALALSPPEGPKVCSRLRPLHGLFKCFRPGREEHSHA